MTANGINITFEGFDKLKDKIEKLGQGAVNEVDAILQVNAESIATLAKRNLSGVKLNPNDFTKPLEKLYAVTDNINNLKQRISAKNEGILRHSVVADMPYAAYVEFGTGGRVDVPKGLEDYAIQFKKPNKQNISMPANPYLFPAFFQIKPRIINDIKDFINS